MADVLDVFNYVFGLIFILEAILKILGFGFKDYLKDGWNRFDFFLVCASIFSFAVFQLGVNLSFNPSVLRILRAARAARIVKLVKSLTGLRLMMETLYFALPQLGNIFMILCLF